MIIQLTIYHLTSLQLKCIANVTSCSWFNKTIHRKYINTVLKEIMNVFKINKKG